jgi:hypothetical protein
MRTQSSAYGMLAAIFSAPGLEIHSDDVLVDVGCGKGRVLNYWLNRRLPNRMIGIELNDDIAVATRARLERYENVKIITGDIAESYPKEGTLFFMYNPFGKETMRSFAENACRMAASGKPIRLAYLNPTCLDVFSSDEWEITRLRSGSADEAVLITHKPVSSNGGNR